MESSLCVVWRITGEISIETYLENFHTETNGDQKIFKQGNETATLEGSAICYTGNGGPIYEQLRDVEDSELKVKIENEKPPYLPYGVTD